MRKIVKLSAIVCLGAASTLAFSEAAFANTSLYDSQSIGLPGGSSAFNVSADADGVKVSGGLIKIAGMSCEASSSYRGGGGAATSGYLDTRLQAVGSKISAGTAQASSSGIGGSISATSTLVTLRGPRVSWSKTSGKRFSHLNVTIDGGNAAKWNYVRLICDGTVTSTSADVQVTAEGKATG